MARSDPYLARQLSVFGAKRALDRRENLCCVLPNSDGDAKRIHTGVYPGSGEEGPTPSEGGEYCISLHLGACVRVTSWERGSWSQVSKEEYNRVLLDMLISGVPEGFESVVRCFFFLR